MPADPPQNEINCNEVNTVVIDKINTLKNTTFKNIPLCAYIYDLSSLNNHLNHVCKHIPNNCEMFYAVKANAEIDILSIIDKHCQGFEVASIGEIQQIYQQFPHAKIIFGGPGKTDQELRSCIESNVEFIHVESLYELQRLDHICQDLDKNINILIRLNIPFKGFSHTRLTMGGKATPFGMDEAMLNQCLNYLTRSKNIHLKGIHLHLASFQVDEKAHIKLIRQYIDYIHQLNHQHKLKLNHLNVGGGIGVKYEDKRHRFNWEYFFGKLNILLKKPKNTTLKLRFECGRSLSVYCGYYVAEVLDLKKSYDKTFAILRGGTNHFRTPYAQSHSHPFEVIKIDAWPKNYPRININNIKIDIVGQLCTPKDMLAYDQEIDSLSIGDIILFTHAGAYAWNISHHDFLSHPHPHKYFLQ